MTCICSLTKGSRLEAGRVPAWGRDGLVAAWSQEQVLRDCHRPGGVVGEVIARGPGEITAVSYQTVYSIGIWVSGAIAVGFFRSKELTVTPELSGKLKVVDSLSR